MENHKPFTPKRNINISVKKSNGQLDKSALIELEISKKVLTILSLFLKDTDSLTTIFNFGDILRLLIIIEGSLIHEEDRYLINLLREELEENLLANVIISLKGV